MAKSWPFLAQGGRRCVSQPGREGGQLRVGFDHRECGGVAGGGGGPHPSRRFGAAPWSSTCSGSSRTISQRGEGVGVLGDGAHLFAAAPAERAASQSRMRSAGGGASERVAAAAAVRRAQGAEEQRARRVAAGDECRPNVDSVCEQARRLAEQYANDIDRTWRERKRELQARCRSWAVHGAHHRDLDGKFGRIWSGWAR